MRIKRKTISIIELTEQEIAMLFDMASEAKEGHVVNYSERETTPGKFFGISIVKPVEPAQHSYKAKTPYPSVA